MTKQIFKWVGGSAKDPSLAYPATGKYWVNYRIGHKGRHKNVYKTFDEARDFYKSLVNCDEKTMWGTINDIPQLIAHEIRI